MSPEEFERLKNEEKEHLRKLRALKQTHRDVQQKKKIVDAVTGMRNPGLEAETDDLTQSFYRDAAVQEARLDLALEGQAPVTGNANDLDKESLAKAEAEALVRQMKAQMGHTPDLDAAPNAAIDPVQNPDSPHVQDPQAPDVGPKTIGRTPLPDAPPPARPPDDKSIGRRRGI